MKERPIVFSAPMVRAILAGTKTQTRREIKPQPANDIHPHHEFPNPAVQGWMSSLTHLHGQSTAHICPYGQPGDRLWVRETWRIRGDSDHDHVDQFGTDDIQYRADRDESYIDRYRPSIHMPRKFSRITLEVTGVRVERLQDISREDVIAEGCEAPRCPACGYTNGDAAFNCDHRLCGKPMPPHESTAYRALWESINGAGAWDANPWVWVVEFKRAT